MVSLKTPSPDWITPLYDSGGPDPSFADVLGHAPAGLPDEELAELIESDGRARIARGRPVGLDRYLGAVPDLPRRIVPLDAAIDVTLRSMCADGRPTKEAVERLVTLHPALAVDIHGAAMLGEAMWSTATLRARAAPAPGALPPDVGPAVRSGAPRYQVQRLLGSGGWGTVYLAADRQLSEPDRPALVAVKLFDSAAADPWVRQRMGEEATKARRVAHDNVVRVLDLGVSDRDEDYIVYEYIDGGDLRAWTQSHTLPMDQRDAARLMAKVARGVQAAHAAGLVHCDLKPGNILVTSSGEPKVADFGIAVRAGEHERPWDRGDSGRPAGNLAFISPEQYRMEEGCLCIPSDLYALGGILYYLLTGALPNGQTAAEIAQINDKDTGRTAPPSPRALRPKLDRDLDAICRRAMAVRPQDRHSSAGALADDLEAFLRTEPIRWTKPSHRRLATLWARRRPGVAVASLLAVLAVLGGTAAGTYWWSVASFRAQETQRERAKIDAAADALSNTYRYMSLMQARRLGELFLTRLMAMEWLNGSGFYSQPGDHNALWRDRDTVVRAVIEDAKKHGRGESVDTLLWQGALGFWLVDDGDVAKAEPLLKETLQTWRTVVKTDDPFAQELEMLIAAAGVHRLWLAAKAGHLTPQQRDELPGLAQVLGAEQEFFTGRWAGGPVHKQVLRAAVDLNSSTLLDRQTERRRLSKRLKSFEN